MSKLETKEDLKDKKSERVKRKDEWKCRGSLFIDLMMTFRGDVSLKY